MVINRRDIKRKRKDNNSNCNLLDNSPKRTKVHAQRKFAQGSNVSSPVITPVKEIEKQEKLKPDVLPEPQELLPMNRPHTEDFLTFLCFRGTSMLPPSLNFFNTAPLDCRVNSQPMKSEPIEACPPLANISAKATAGGSERPFIAFGVRKRADPVLVSKHMDKKRRHALALQALRRKYQEQKMAKIRAVTISKLSEKVTTNKSIVRTRSVTKSENSTKKNLPQKTRVKIVATKHVKITRTSLKAPLRATIKTPLKAQLQKRMCLRSFRGRFIHHELQLKNSKKTQPSKVIKKVQQLKAEIKNKRETSSEFSSGDDEPLMKTVKVIKPSSKVPLPKVAKKCAGSPKKPMEINFRLTRASYPLYISNREQTVKRKIQITRSSFPTKSPFVKLTPPRLILPEENQKYKNDKLRSSKIQKKMMQNKEENSMSLQKSSADKTKKEDTRKLDKELKKKTDSLMEKNLNIKSDEDIEKDTKKDAEKPETNLNISEEIDIIKKPIKPETSTGREVNKKLDAAKVEADTTAKNKIEKPDRKNIKVSTEMNKDLRTLTVTEEKKQDENLKKKETVLNKDSKKKAEQLPEKNNINLENVTENNIKIKPCISKSTKVEVNLEKNLKKIRKSPEKDVKNKINKPKAPIDEPKVTQRPTRKTKEAAAIYMEILGHKLVNEGDLDDDSISIDSFPELPNVRKTEQRENELKAKAKCKTNENVCNSNPEEKMTKKTGAFENSPSNLETIVTKLNSPKVNEKDISPIVRNTRYQKNNEKCKDVKPNKIHKDILSDSDASLKKNDLSNSQFPKVKTETFKRNLRNMKTEPIDAPTKYMTRRTISKSPTNYTSLSESEESVAVQTAPPKEKQKQFKLKTKLERIPKSTIKTRSKKIKESDSDSDESTTSKTNQTPIKPITTKKAVKNTVLPQFDNSFSDSDEEPLSKFTQTKSKDEENKNTENKNSEEFVNSSTSILKTKETKAPETVVVDEKETVCDMKIVKTDTAIKEIKKDIIIKNENKKKAAEESTLNISTKPKRECTKRPQNYLPLFSSSEDEDKYFHGFVKYENPKQGKNPKVENKCHPTPSADLLCKDVDKRFGKGKVNMSTEQIEKWLKDSAIAGGNNIKKETDEILKFDEKIPLEINNSELNLPIKVEVDKPMDKEKQNDTNNLSVPTKTNESTIANTQETCNSSSNTKKQGLQNLSSKSKPSERKMIFRKERKVPVPNVNAFSANNESSVYAFEADNEDTISTPFRRPVRRPSSTATSRSEDSLSRCDDSSKVPGKFRLPQVIKQENTRATNKQEVSLMLSTDESNTTSIAVQLNLDSTEVFPETANAENQLPTETEDGEQLFYIPLQPGKQTSTQIIQGVAVKLGTKGVNGPNQRVVMSAKLVTHTPAGAQKLTEKPLISSTQMYPPPAVTVQKLKLDSRSSLKTGMASKSCDRTSENSEDFKYKIPSSPSASSSSSTKINTKRPNIKSRHRPLEFCNPVAAKEFPSNHSPPVLLEAPVFHPNEKEFQDPLEYIEKIRNQAEKFGICKIVPPSNFKPECKVSDDMRFTAYNQYVHKMLHRWGPNFKELMAITKYLKTQNIAITHPPWIGGMEIDLPRLYQIVQSLGGLKEVIEKKKWPKVSELMKIPKSAQDRVTKLDDIYCKYLLPYDTLSPAEREKLFDEVETDWAKRESRTLLRSQQSIMSRDISPNTSESDSDDESEECIVKGRNMALNAFYRIARNTMSMWFKTMEPTAQDVEQEFWKHVTVKQNHICVHSGSIDSGNWGYGFAVSKNSPFARHAWNLKVLTNNSGSVLRSMGPVMGVTVPTLHVGMVFSACCWYRDPHSLPWIEYLHTGGNKIWYGIPNSMSSVFHKTLIKLVPNYCRNKPLWLPSDTAMVPPSLLVESGVSLCRTIQEPGQFIVVFPKAFTSSICTGYVVSESVYFAPLNWLSSAQNVFDELQKNCEPSMFSLERLLISVASDIRSSIDVLKQVMLDIEQLRQKEKIDWIKLQEIGLTKKERLPLPDAPMKKKKKLQNDSDDYECEICCRNLFVSWVNESQEDATYCLSHTIECIEKNKIEIQHCKLIFTYDDQDFVNLIEKIKNTMETKMQKKLSGKNT